MEGICGVAATPLWRKPVGPLLLMRRARCAELQGSFTRTRTARSRKRCSAGCAARCAIGDPTTKACSYGAAAGSGGRARRRLTVPGRGGGRQPISNEDGTSVIVFNGEIYNYQDLRAGLLA